MFNNIFDIFKLNGMIEWKICLALDSGVVYEIQFFSTFRLKNM